VSFYVGKLFGYEIMSYNTIETLKATNLTFVRTPRMVFGLAHLFLAW
jgi:hypothetical protein